MKKSLVKVYIELYDFFNGLLLYLYNLVVNKLPFHFMRLFLYRFIIKIGKNSSILLNVRLRGKNIIIGDNTVINSDCLLDGRGSSNLIIGNNVDIAPYVKIWTVDHNPNSSNHEARSLDVIIKDNCWIASSATILPGITLAEGTVVAAGSIVTKNTEPYTIVAGIPAKIISKRNRNLDFKNYWRPWFE